MYFGRQNHNSNGLSEIRFILYLDEWRQPIQLASTGERGVDQLNRLEVGTQMTHGPPWMTKEWRYDKFKLVTRCTIIFLTERIVFSRTKIFFSKKNKKGRLKTDKNNILRVCSACTMFAITLHLRWCFRDISRQKNCSYKQPRAQPRSHLWIEAILE